LQVLIANDRHDKSFVENLPQTLSSGSNQNSLNLAIVGHSSSGDTLEAIETYNSQGIVSISPMATSTDLNKPSDSKKSYFFRTPTNDEVASKMLADFAKRNSLTKVVAVYNEKSPYASSLARAFKDSLGVSFSFVHTCDYPDGDIDDDSLEKIAKDCLSAARKKDSQLNSILLIPKDEKIKLAISFIKNKGSLKLFGGDTMYRPDIFKEENGSKIAQLAAEGELVVAIPWHRRDEKETSLETYASQLIGTKGINWRTAMTYDAVQAIIQGLRNIELSGDLKSDRTALREALEKLDFRANGVEGIDSIQFDSNNHNRVQRQGIGVLVRVQKKEGTDDYDFVSVDPSEYSPGTP
jgi:branched-chain amino acid transport system substrate-binding protein